MESRCQGFLLLLFLDSQVIPWLRTIPCNQFFLLSKLEKQKMAWVLKAAQSLKDMHCIFLSVSIYHNT